MCIVRDIYEMLVRFSLYVWEDFMMLPLGSITVMLSVVYRMFEHGAVCVPSVIFAPESVMALVLSAVGLVYCTIFII